MKKAVLLAVSMAVAAPTQADSARELEIALAQSYCEIGKRLYVMYYKIASTGISRTSFDSEFLIPKLLKPDISAKVRRLYRINADLAFMTVEEYPNVPKELFSRFADDVYNECIKRELR